MLGPDGAIRTLTQYVADPGVRALLALGKNVTIRPYAIETVDTRDNDRLVVALYSATFDQDGQKTTFLVRMMTRRLADDAAGRAVLANHRRGRRRAARVGRRRELADDEVGGIARGSPFCYAAPSSVNHTDWPY